jgi:hypothetical protein
MSSEHVTAAAVLEPDAVERLPMPVVDTTVAV